MFHGIQCLGHPVYLKRHTLANPPLLTSTPSILIIKFLISDVCESIYLLSSTKTVTCEESKKDFVRCTWMGHLNIFQCRYPLCFATFVTGIVTQPKQLTVQLTIEDFLTSLFSFST